MLITGCHRSGTSLLASIVSALIEDERPNDLPALIDNPGGYYESQTLKELNDRILAELGYRWDRPPLHPIYWGTGARMQELVEARQNYGSHKRKEPWVDKDPRLCITIGAYQHILLRRVPIAVSLRNPDEVAISLYRRDGLPLEHGYLIWFLYNRAISLQMNKTDVLVLYEELLEASEGASPNRSLLELKQWLGTHLNPQLVKSKLDSVLAEQIQPGLRRSSSSALNQNEESGATESKFLRALCTRIYATIRGVSASSRTEGMKQEFNAIPASLIDRYEQILFQGEPDIEYLRNTQGSRENLQELSRRELEKKIQVLNHELTLIKKSTSWKLTKPARFFIDGLRRFRKD